MFVTVLAGTRGRLAKIGGTNNRGLSTKPLEIERGRIAPEHFQTERGSNHVIGGQVNGSPVPRGGLRAKEAMQRANSKRRESERHNVVKLNEHP